MDLALPGAVDRVDWNDILAAVEAAYTVQIPIRSWNRALLESVARTLPGALGGFACLYVMKEGKIRFDADSLASFAVADERLEQVLEGLRAEPPDWLAKQLEEPRGTVRCAMTSELDPRGAPWSLADDGVNIVTADLDQPGWLLSLGVPGTFRLTAVDRATFARVGAHVLAATRLRARLSTAAAAAAQGLKRLTATERAVVGHTARGLTTKETAYTQGISDATVRVLLMRAARKCGVKGRKELVSWYESRGDDR